MQLSDADRKLITDHMYIVFAVWRTLTNNKIKTAYKDDLFEAGYEGLCEATQRWDPDRASFGTVAFFYAKSRMYRELKYINRRCAPISSLEETIKSSVNEDARLADLIEDPRRLVEDAADESEKEYVIEVINKKGLLTPKEFDILLNYCDGLTYEQIGQLYGVSRQQIGLYIAKIRKKVLPLLAN